MPLDYNVLLYYGYARVENAEQFRSDHHKQCVSFGLLGRIIVASEGINGTVSGTRKACQQYVDYVKSDLRFESVAFKTTPCTGHAFSKLHVRLKPEIVHAGLPHLYPQGKAGQYVTPKELIQMKDDPNVVLLDARSRYEHRLGRFRGAVTLDIGHFREFPDRVADLAPYKEKHIVTYCTGGVKCEKASAYLLQKGFKNVYQLKGGIVQYGLDTDGRDFEGACYVFDERMHIPINRYNPTTVSKCWVCRAACNRMVNCANPSCNVHIPLCLHCGDALEGACSKTCCQHPRKRRYDGTGRYGRQLRGYNPYQALRGRTS